MQLPRPRCVPQLPSLAVVGGAVFQLIEVYQPALDLTDSGRKRTAKTDPKPPFTIFSANVWSRNAQRTSADQIGKSLFATHRNRSQRDRLSGALCIWESQPAGQHSSPIRPKTPSLCIASHGQFNHVAFPVSEVDGMNEIVIRHTSRLARGKG